jgi:hypothetical protein
MKKMLFMIMLLICSLSVAAERLDPYIAYDGIGDLVVRDSDVSSSCSLLDDACTRYNADYLYAPDKMTFTEGEGSVLVMDWQGNVLSLTGAVDEWYKDPGQYMPKHSVVVVGTNENIHLIRFEGIDDSDRYAVFSVENLGETYKSTYTDTGFGTFFIEGKEFNFTVDELNENIMFHNLGRLPDWEVEVVDIAPERAEFKVNGEVLFVDEGTTKAINQHTSLYFHQESETVVQYSIFKTPTVLRDWMDEYTTRTYQWDGTLYEVETIAISGGADPEVIFRVNGEITEKLGKYDAYRLSDGPTIEIIDILENEGTESGSGDKVYFSLSYPEAFDELWVSVENHALDLSADYTDDTKMDAIQNLYGQKGWDIEEETFDGNDLYIFSRSRGPDMYDYIIAWYHNDVFVTIAIEEWNENVMEERQIEMLIQKYLLMFPSSIDFNQDSCEDKKIFLGNSFNRQGYIGVTYHTEGNVVKNAQLRTITQYENSGGVSMMPCKILSDTCASGTDDYFNCQLVTSCPYPTEKPNTGYELRVSDSNCPQVEDFESIDPLPAPDYYRKVELVKGWNMISLGKGLEFQTSEDFEDLLEAAYYYDPDTRKFYDLIKDEDPLEDALEEKGFASIWVYLSGEMELYYELDLPEIQHTVEELDFTFRQGWNFYTILPHMYSKYEGGYLNIFEDEDDNSVIKLDRIYVWDAEEGDWDYGRYTEIEEEDLLDEELVGLPILMYYEEDLAVKLRPAYEELIPDFPDLPDEPMPVPIPTEPTRPIAEQSA